ncbi:MAG: TIGR02270 family protein [Proteobacteria bacterium]|nr:TIGR02270 family protein [Pseudomonadota bacterium]MBU4294694.1 TIGR02270 family protein [Pseudomonadota bacterium]MCG2749779.1 TIGR02270 family protein [Desulfobulbaceae bacterium]
MAVIIDIISQHAEEAAFLWLLRDAAVQQPHFDLCDLAQLDERVEAHLDGLRIAGEPGWQICREALALEEAGEVFAAAVLAFESGIEERLEQVFAVAAGKDELSRAIISALGWLEWGQAEKYVQGLLEVGEPAASRLGIAAAAAHRQDPGRPLAACLVNDELLLRCRALRTVGELGRVDLLFHIAGNLAADDPDLRFHAARSTMLLGGEGAVPVMQGIAEGDSEQSEQACAMAVRGMPPAEAHDWLKSLAGNKGRQRLAVTGTGILGDPAAIPWLLQIMEIPELARPAGEAFSMITGVDLAYADLEGEWPEGFSAGPTEEPEDEDVAMDPDEDLPWPAPELIARWWDAHKGEFVSGVRYLVGKPINREHLQQVVRTGFQRQRAAAAIELALLQPGQPLFEVRAPGFRQQKLLGGK